MTFHDLKWPWGHEERSLVAIFRLRVWILPLTRCLRLFWLGFVQNSRFSIFSHWLIMERPQSWPDLRSPISKFWDIHSINTVSYSNRWKFQGNRSVGVALTNIQTLWGEVTWLDRPGDLTFRDLGLKFSQHVRTRCMIRCAKNRGAQRCRFFFWQSGKNGGE